MTYFKISLLTPQFPHINNQSLDENIQNNFFFEDVISEFYAQIDNYRSNKYFDPIRALTDSTNSELHGTKQDDIEDSHLTEPDIEPIDPLLLSSDAPGIRKDGIESYTSRTNPFEHSALQQRMLYCYTYNEKFHIGQNAQKTLTFSMNKMIAIQDEWKENPFIRHMIVGNQILLTDQYKNEYLFTITNIQYNIKENNIIYDISCQDTFSYQTIRQNAGYTIENDASSADFIGALTLDEWVQEYIKPECRITYQYIPLTDYLYEDTDGNLHQLNYSYFVDNTITPPNNIKRILKYGYNPRIEYDPNDSTKVINPNDSAYFDTIPFSCSGSNANAALISLAEQMNFVLNTCERAELIDHSNHKSEKNLQRSKFYKRYFWLEPAKNTNRLGLTYSPNNSIQTFNLKHQGESLTTILNVQSNTINDEIVNIFPTIPPIFYQWFNSAEWLNTGYYPGMFSALCSNKIYYHYDNSNEIPVQDNIYWFKTNLDDRLTDAECQYFDLSETSTYLNKDILINDDFKFFPKENQINNVSNIMPSWWKKEKNNKSYLYCPIYTKKINIAQPNEDQPKYRFLFDIPSLYERISFKDSQNVNVSQLLINNKLCTSRGYQWELVIVRAFDKVENETTNTYYNLYVVREDLDNLPFLNAQTQDRVYAFIRIQTGDVEQDFNVVPQLYMNFNREVTAEELEFAEIADQCPWLENKLIDFSYFYNNKILSREEYSTLIDILYNQLRIINGQLMFYSDAYYRALHDRTKILSNLTNNLDTLGAVCEANIITPLKNRGVINKIEKQNFLNAYDEFKAPIENITPLVNYADIQTDYFNKYFSAEQRFLKNIYNFQQYFNARNVFSNQTIYNYVLTIHNDWIFNPDIAEDATIDDDYYTFKTTNWTKLTNSFNIYNTDTETPLVPLFLHGADNTYTNIQVVDKLNYGSYYTPEIEAGTITEAKSFIVNGQYLRNILKVKVFQDIIDGITHYYWDEEKETEVTLSANTSLYIKTAYNNIEIKWHIIRFDADDNNFYAICYKQKDTVENLIPIGTTTKTWYYNNTVLLAQPHTDDLVSWELIAPIDMCNNYLNGLSKPSGTPLSNAFWQDIQNNYSSAEVLEQAVENAKTYFNEEDFDNYVETQGFNRNDYDLNHYQSFIPLNEIYYYTSDIPQYNITETGDNTFLATKKETNDPISLSYVNITNASKAYRMTVNKGGLLGTSLSLFFATGPVWSAISTLIWIYADQGQPNNSGYTIRDSFGNIMASGKSEDYVEWDNNYRYFTNEDSMSLYRKYSSGDLQLEDGEKLKVEWTTNGRQQHQEINEDRLSIYWPLLSYTYTDITSESEKFKYKASRLFLLNKNSLISADNHYRILLIRQSPDPEHPDNLNSHRDIMFNSDNIEEFISAYWKDKYIDSIAYYLLYSASQRLDLTQIKFTDKSITLSAALAQFYSNVEWNDNNSFSITHAIDGKNQTLTFLIMREENFDRDMLFEDDPIPLVMQPDYYSTIKRIYDQNNIEIDLTTYPIYEGYYILNQNDDAFKLATNFNNTQTYYTKLADNSYVRTYTLQQLMNNDNTLDIVYLASDIYSTHSFINDQKVFENIPIIRKHITGKRKDGKLHIASITEEPAVIYDKISFEKGNVTIDKTIITKESKGSQSIGNMSNGTFWYKFRDAITDFPTLHQNAAAIETQLTEYWTSAYTASRYCEYMLPETWTPLSDQKHNYFSSDIIQCDTSNNLVLKPDYLPEVSIYINNNKKRLNQYQFIHKNCRKVKNYDALNRSVTYAYNTTDTINPIAILEEVKHNPALIHLFDILKEHPEDWQINVIGTTTYYYVASNRNGMQWPDFIYNKIGTACDLYNGLYVMAYQKLKTAYKDLPETNYWKLKEAHDAWWQTLYNTYGYLMLENTYKSETATTSSELLKLAKYAFKDYSKPEANYSISVIDVASLSGYNGQEIRIGDGIKVDARDYYNEYDQIFDSLSEYLFITDINYNLRSPTDISLTVNSIKYQDKLIQKLVKLIK